MAAVAVLNTNIYPIAVRIRIVIPVRVAAHAVTAFTAVEVDARGTVDIDRGGEFPAAGAEDCEFSAGAVVESQPNGRHLFSAELDTTNLDQRFTAGTGIPHIIVDGNATRQRQLAFPSQRAIFSFVARADSQ